MNRWLLIVLCLLAAITADAGLLGDLMRRRTSVTSVAPWLDDGLPYLGVQWSFAAATATNTVIDVSGYGVNGINGGSPLPTWTNLSGRTCQKYTGGYFDRCRTKATVFAGGTNMVIGSFSVWINPTATFANAPIFLHNGLASGGLFGSTVTNRARFLWGGLTVDSTAMSVPYNSWTHIAGVAKTNSTQSILTIYINGSSNNTSVGAKQTWSANVGPSSGGVDANGAGFVGFIDDCRWYTNWVSANVDTWATNIYIGGPQ